MQPIGTIHTPYLTPEDMPVQPAGAGDTQAMILLRPGYQAGLADLDGFSHIYLIYEFHLSSGYSLVVRPFLDDKTHGVFATRAPRRPNPLGLSIVRLLSIEANRLTVAGADIVDGTPLLDIKPYIEAFDRVEHPANGWLTASGEEIRNTKSDRRFSG